MPKHELSHHMSTCVDRCSVNTDCGKNFYNFLTDKMVQHFCFTPVQCFSAVPDESQRKFQVPVSTWTVPACDEDWDQGQFLSFISFPNRCLKTITLTKFINKNFKFYRGGKVRNTSNTICLGDFNLTAQQRLVSMIKLSGGFTMSYELNRVVVVPDTSAEMVWF